VTALTNATLAGFTPQEVMEMAGYENYKTTQIYVRLAGEVFPDKAAALEARYAEGRAEE
jgi:hypothetical protein